MDHAIKQSEFMSGTCFSGSVADTESGSSSAVLRSSSTATKQYVPLRPKNIGGFKTPSLVHAPGRSADGVAVESSPVNQNQKPAAPASSNGKPHAPVEGRPSYWYVNWRKPQQKKHKTWDGDAYLMHKGDKLTLVTEKGLM